MLWAIYLLTETTGPETIDKAMIGAQRHVCSETGTVYWSRLPSNGGKNPALNLVNKESVIYRLHPELEGRAPLELALTELGARRVEELLWKLFYGLPA